MHALRDTRPAVAIVMVGPHGEGEHAPSVVPHRLRQRLPVVVVMAKADAMRNEEREALARSIITTEGVHPAAKQAKTTSAVQPLPCFAVVAEPRVYEYGTAVPHVHGELDLLTQWLMDEAGGLLGGVERRYLAARTQRLTEVPLSSAFGGPTAPATPTGGGKQRSGGSGGGGGAGNGNVTSSYLHGVPPTPAPSMASLGMCVGACGADDSTPSWETFPVHSARKGGKQVPAQHTSVEKAASSPVFHGLAFAFVVVVVCIVPERVHRAEAGPPTERNRGRIRAHGGGRHGRSACAGGGRPRAWGFAAHREAGARAKRCRRDNVAVGGGRRRAKGGSQRDGGQRSGM